MNGDLFQMKRCYSKGDNCIKPAGDRLKEEILKAHVLIIKHILMCI